MQRGFTKLFNTIVTSTIWQEDDKTRIVWITMLAISDASGIVSASIPGLANVAKVAVTACRRAIEKLLDKDPDSRTKDFDGRRIETIDGGWRILNYQKYRRMLNEEERKEYKARWIAQRRSVDKRRQPSTKSRQASIMSTQAEAEADAEAEAKKKKAAAKPPTSEDWLKKLETNPAYKGINVRALHAKMVVWCEIRGLQPTLRRLVTWLNREDKPMPRNGSKPNYGRNYLPPPREPSEDELAEARAIAKAETEKFRQSINKC